jgi:hypothetical protein
MLARDLLKATQDDYVASSIEGYGQPNNNNGPIHQGPVAGWSHRIFLNRQVSAKIFEPNISVIFQWIFLKFKMHLHTYFRR